MFFSSHSNTKEPRYFLLITTMMVIHFIVYVAIWGHEWNVGGRKDVWTNKTAFPFFNVKVFITQVSYCRNKEVIDVIKMNLFLKLLEMNLIARFFSSILICILNTNLQKLGYIINVHDVYANMYVNINRNEVYNNKSFDPKL